MPMASRMASCFRLPPPTKKIDSPIVSTMMVTLMLCSRMISPVTPNMMIMKGTRPSWNPEILSPRAATHAAT